MCEYVNCSLLKGEGALQASLYQVPYKCIGMSPVLYMSLKICMCVGMQAAYNYVCMFSVFFPSLLTLCKVLQAYSRYRLILGKVVDPYRHNLCCMWEVCDVCYGADWSSWKHIMGNYVLGKEVPPCLVYFEFALVMFECLCFFAVKMSLFGSFPMFLFK